MSDSPAMAIEGRRPLVVTACADRPDSALTVTLMAAGIRVWPMPTTLAPEHAAAAARLARYLDDPPGWDWIAVTSVRGAEVLARSRRSPTGGRRRGWPRIAAVGPRTAARLRDLGLAVDVVAEVSTGTALARAILRRTGRRPARVLWPRAEGTRNDLRSLLRYSGVTVVDPIVYGKAPGRPPSMAIFVRRLRAGAVDAVCFDAPTAVWSLVGAMWPAPVDLLRRTRIASLGTSTTAALRALSLAADCEAATRDAGSFGARVTGMVEARWSAR